MTVLDQIKETSEFGYGHVTKDRYESLKDEDKKAIQEIINSYFEKKDFDLEDDTFIASVAGAINLNEENSLNIVERYSYYDYLEYREVEEDFGTIPWDLPEDKDERARLEDGSKKLKAHRAAQNVFYQLSKSSNLRSVFRALSKIENIELDKYITLSKS